MGKQLDDLGIRIRAQLVNEFAGNPTGGVHQGSTNVGQAQLGATFDLNKIAGIEGAQFYLNFVQDYGHGLAHDVTGTFTKAQEIYKNEFNLPRLGVFAYEQKLLDDRLDIFVGRLGSTSFYGRLANDCYFESGISCSVPQVLNSSAGFTFATSASWASNVRYWVAPDSYLQAGAFEVDPFIQQTNGFNWSINHATGVTVPFEFSKGISISTKSAILAISKSAAMSAPRPSIILSSTPVVNRSVSGAGHLSLVPSCAADST